MTTSIEAEVENQILNAISTAGVTGVNLYGGDRRGLKLLPYIYADAKIDSEDIAPFTGVFSCSTTIQYRVRADTSTRSSFDSKFQEVVQAFYTDPDLASQMTQQSSSVTFYIANISRVDPMITSESRTWSKDIIMDLKVTSKQT